MTVCMKSLHGVGDESYGLTRGPMVAYHVANAGSPVCGAPEENMPAAMGLEVAGGGVGAGRHYLEAAGGAGAEVAALCGSGCRWEEGTCVRSGAATSRKMPKEVVGRRSAVPEPTGLSGTGNNVGDSGPAGTGCNEWQTGTRREQSTSAASGAGSGRSQAEKQAWKPAAGRTADSTGRRRPEGKRRLGGDWPVARAGRRGPERRHAAAGGSVGKRQHGARGKAATGSY
ncbi:uncharacterized protein LOC131875689 [Cryptomeria japonica]|uniref:uncharacterized protein LOC131875689 n=1 Tax=Cryptomeria japonica TaxID=3369 RepID=UPI0027DAA925|nr:uncharacterized protein LOC131875689 [Cryptomeria japonica]